MRNETAVQQAVDIFIIAVIHGDAKSAITNIGELLPHIYNNIIKLGTNPSQPINTTYPPNTDDYIVCLEDGKKLKMLKRYLKKNHNMTLDQYRQKWGLPATFAGVAANYSKKRSELAKAFKLGVRG